MTSDRLTVAIAHEVFPEERDAGALEQRATDARRAGAELLLLPELPLIEWVPAAREARDEDAEPPGGPRCRRMARVARTAGIALHGGAIVRDPGTGERFNRALLFDDGGNLLCHYDKLQVPCEEGFWESDHYKAGRELAEPCGSLGLTVGLQICSDVQRPTLCHALAAMGAELIVAPRATPTASYERWLTVLRANAITAATYVVSVNRPGPERGVPIGGPSVAIAPDGSVLLETEDPLAVVTLERSAVERARRDYPGYLEVRSDLYARVWTEVERKRA